MNILTFDIEEWFHILDFEETRSEEQWRTYEVRIYENVERLFRILEETKYNPDYLGIGHMTKEQIREYLSVYRQVYTKGVRRV